MKIKHELHAFSLHVSRSLTCLVGLLAIIVALIGCQPAPRDSSDDNDVGNVPDTSGGVTVGELQDYLLPNSLSGQVLMFSEFNDDMVYEEYTDYIEIEPNKHLRCSIPEAEEYKIIADQLGGFRLPYKIPVEGDATVPRIYSGFEDFYNEVVFADGLSPAPSSNAIDIQRPDKVGQAGNTGFYLSSNYGLILVGIDSGTPQESNIQCAMSLPGNPKNFLIKNDTLIAIINSLDRSNSGLIQFSITGNRLEYLSSQFFENQQIIDARLFNDTLSVFVEEYESENDASSDTPVVSQFRSPQTVPISDDCCSFYHPIRNHRLQILNIFPELSPQYSEVFLPTDTIEDGINRFYSNYNKFLSASGEYLVVTESLTNQLFSHYETKTYLACTAYQERSYEYCTTKWKRIPNPDYVTPTNSGVISCEGDLLSCLRNIGPKVSKYIKVPDGLSCQTYTWSICTAHEYKSYTYPVYTTEFKTGFQVFRFQDGSFVKLDDSLARITDGNIDPTDDAFQVDGHIYRHDHIHFNNDVLYTVTSNGQLSVFSLQGNSAIYVTALDLEHEEYANISTNFTDNRIYISESHYNYYDTYQWSSMNTIRIDDPIDPEIDSQVSIPTQLDQLIFGNDVLIGIGNTQQNSSQGSFDFGTITSFTPLGIETDNLVLGTDYQYYSHNISWDDQVIGFNPSRNRILLPYSNYRPFDPEMLLNTHRLTMATVTDSDVSEIHTFSFSERPDRSLDVAENLAFSFSSRHVNLLHYDQEWQRVEIFNGEIPSSFYKSRSFPYLVKNFQQSNHHRFVLINDESISTSDSIDTLTVQKAGTHYCTWERVYFDNDRILIVSEPPGVYFDYQDCAWDGTDAVTLQGYRISESGFKPIGDSDELQTLYSQIQTDIRCVIDINNWEGEEIKDYTDIPEEAVCYPAERYYEIIWEEYVGNTVNRF